MPVPEEKLHNPGKLNRWFAVSSVLMTLSLFWMIWVDYDRPWHDHQTHFFINKAALAHLDFVNATTQDRENELTVARKNLDAARELDRSINGGKRNQLKAELAKEDLEFKTFDAPFGRITQVLQVSRDTYERKLGEFGPDHRETKEAKRVVEEQEKEAEELRKKKEEHEDKRREVMQQLKALDNDVRLADRRVKDLEQVAQSAKEKDQQFRGVLTDDGLLAGVPIVSEVINAPLFDFSSPKNTAGRWQVNQLVLPNVRQRLNYLDSYTTDRCTTCHVAINDPTFTKEALARKFEQSIPGMNEVLQKKSKPVLALPPVPVIDANGDVTLQPGRVTDHWKVLSKPQQNEYFEKLLGLVNQYLTSTGRKKIQVGEPLLAHPNLELFSSVDSPHPINAMGCTVCHEGNPQETDFILAAHSPPTHEVEDRWRDEYYISILGIPNMTFDTMAHFWDRPMRWPQYTEASCAKCHGEIADIDRFRGERTGERINQGRYLFASLGCINCHNVDALKDSRKVGPQLTNIASKLTPAFAQQWIYFPQKFRPTTRMPHFFEQENNRAESKNQFDPNPKLRTETEVAAISKYLFAVSQPYRPMAKPADVTGDVDRGRELFKRVGCLACHSNLAEFGEEWIAKDLMQRTKATKDEALAKAKGMNYEEKALYARDHFVTDNDTWLHPAKAAFENGGLEPTPTFSRFAPDLSGIGSKVGFDWLYSWLMQPSHYFPETKMPSLRLSPNEAADVATYLLTFKNERFVQEEFAINAERAKMADDLIMGILTSLRSDRASRNLLNDEGGELTQALSLLLEPSLKKQPAYDLVSSLSHQDKKLVFLGSKMIGHYGCYACHLIPGFESTTPPGTDLSTWAEKPVTQLDFAFYDHAFHDLRHEKENVFGHVYPENAEELNKWSPGENPKEQITHTHAAFARHKLLNPRIWDREKIKAPYDKLKMPNFYLTQDEADSLTTFLLSRMPSRVNEKLRVDYKAEHDGPIARGRNLVRELNCIGCHEIEDNVPTIQQYFRRTLADKLVFDLLNAPPSLRGEGAKLQHNWFHDFLLNVESLRPWLQIRMPSFNITGDQATTLVEYFAALSQEGSKKLTTALNPIEEFRKSEKEKAAKEGHAVGDKEDGPKTGEDWYQQESLKAHAELLDRFAVERKLVRSSELDDLKNPPESMRPAQQKVLARTDFIRRLYDVPYPFVEPPRPLENDERFDQGSKFFNDMGCLKCHVLGSMLPGPAKNTDDFPQIYRLDGVRGEGEKAMAILNGQPYPIGATIDGHKLISAGNTYYESGDVETKAIVEGPKADGSGTEKILLQAASAPNLSLTHRRLRRGWVHEWMLDPALIQPGTKMPQNFPNHKSPFEGDQRYPGTGDDHINLLVDFLYDAGTRGYRAPLPKIVAAEPKPVEEFKDE